ncbi:MAG: hypothetical protein K2I52_01655, partial [Muribaculaceae bacterium]|nr:hypothetical protein [Muribaculaceae bacterium]
TYTILCFFCGLIACKPNSKLYEEFRNTRINFEFSEMTKLSKNSVPDNNSSYIQFVYVDSLQCSSCLSNKLIIWEELLEDITAIQPNFAVCIIVATSSQNDHDRLQKILRLRSSELIMYADSNNHFISQNPIIHKSKVFKTFIIDKDGQTIIFGDPTVNINVKNLTIKTFKSM